MQTLPVIAQVREQGASAAYMAILPADMIFAHRWANIGSIGVIIYQYDYSESNDKAGIKYVPILTSPSKDIGSAERALTKEERAHYQAEVDFIYQGFLKDVATYRNLSIDKVKAVADGTTMLAHKAKEAGLIDEIGGEIEVKNYLRTTIGEEPVICRDANNIGY
jgi:protease-4